MQAQNFMKKNSDEDLPNISVSSPLLDTAKSHFTYLVTGYDQLGNIQIRRRFNDFYYLREALKKKWAGLYIPPVPQKMLTGNKDQSNIEMRRRFFESFLNLLATQKHLYYCNITQEFLRNNSLDMEKYYTTFTYPKPQQILQQYVELYPDLNGIAEGKYSPSIEHKKAITDFQQYLKKASNELKGIKSTIQAIVETRNQFSNQLNICNTQALPEYEKNVYGEYLSNDEKQDAMLFANNQKVKNSTQKLKQTTKQNSFELLEDFLAYELREVDAMQELINDKKNFENHSAKCNQKLLTAESQLAKLSGGKTTFKSLFSKGNKNQQIQKLQQQIPRYQSDVEQWRAFCNSLTTVIAEKQIPKFKKYKQNKYYQTIHQTAQNELRYLGAYGDLMKSIVQGILMAK